MTNIVEFPHSACRRVQPEERAAKAALARAQAVAHGFDVGMQLRDALGLAFDNLDRLVRAVRGDRGGHAARCRDGAENPFGALGRLVG